MTFDERVQLFFAGFTGPVPDMAAGDAADVLRGRIVALAEGRIFDLEADRLAVAGYAHGLHDCFSDSPVWSEALPAVFLAEMVALADELSEAAAADAAVLALPEVLDFWVARFAGGGGHELPSGEGALEKIIRRALDGEAGARDLLAVASHHVLVAAAYTRIGFDLSSLPEPVSASAGTPETAMSSSSSAALLEGSATSTLAGSGEPDRAASPETASVDLASPAAAGAPDPNASPEVELIAIGGGFLVSADFDTGQVRVSKVPASLSITAAAGLSMGLETAIRALLIPAEGYRWLDNTSDPLSSSLLLVDDPELAFRLPLMDPVQQPSGPWLHGEVRQAGPQDEGTGQYTCRLYPRMGGDFVEFGGAFGGSLLDIHEAKCSVAARVRNESPS